MQILTKSGIIHSAKGVGGGFEVSNEALKTIKLIHGRPNIYKRGKDNE